MIASALIAVTLTYWGPNHAQMNKQVLEKGKPFNFSRSTGEIRTVNEYLEQVLYISQGLQRPVFGVPFKEAVDPYEVKFQRAGRDRPSDKSIHIASVIEWSANGGIWEDGFNSPTEAQQWGGLRAVNHFHDPLAPEGGYTGIRTAVGIRLGPIDQTGRPYLDLLRKGMSVTTWAMGGNAAEKNYWGYPAVLESMRKFFTDPAPNERQTGLGNSMRALGQVMHLVQDNTVPDHARDLAHPGEGFEEYLKAHKGIFSVTPQPWRVMPLQKIEEGGLWALWDRDIYDNGSPAPTLTEPVGIDEFVQANFFAWNEFYPPSILSAVGLERLGLPLQFTTIPQGTLEGYDNYDWPKLAGPAVAFDFASASPALPLSPCIARFRFQGHNIEPRCWAAYKTPLMQIAQGYSQTVLAVAFPAGRAELVPADPFDLRKWTLRVWNLSSGEDAVTWHIDSAKLMAIIPAGTPAGQQEAISLAGVSGDIPPSPTPWERTFTLSITEQKTLNFMSHSVVVLEGNLGVNKKTPFVYGLPIPNGLPLVMQATTQMQTSLLSVGATNTAECCNPMACTPCGESSDVRQALVQTVKGTIQMIPGERDLLGFRATDSVKEAQSKDARIAGVALIAYTNPMQRYYEAKRPTTHTLKVDNARFACADSVCRRKSDAPDEADVPFPFELTLTLSELMDPSNPPSATDSTYLMVWTTAGTIVEWPLLLWPMYQKGTAPELIADFGGACGHALSRGWVTAEAAGGCYSAARMPSCGGAKHESWTRWIVVGPIVGLAAKIADKDFFSIPGLPRVLQLAGVAPTTTEATMCAPPVLNPGNINITCISNSNAFIYSSTVMYDQNGACPSIPPMPPLNQTAEYEGGVSPEWTKHYEKLFGTTSYPKWVTTLN